jgi:hypothetical protein
MSLALGEKGKWGHIRSLERGAGRGGCISRGPTLYITGMLARWNAVSRGSLLLINSD